MTCTKNVLVAKMKFQIYNPRSPVTSHALENQERIHRLIHEDKCVIIDK